VMNADGTIFGLMPHPEAAGEIVLGSTDGLLIFQGMAKELAPTRARTPYRGLIDMDMGDTVGLIDLSRPDAT